MQLDITITADTHPELVHALGYIMAQVALGSSHYEGGEEGLHYHYQVTSFPTIGTEEDISMWEKRWPNYCRMCDGAGQQEYSFDPSPAGVSLSAGSMTDVEVCEGCTNKGVCPRCGGPAWNPYDDLDDIPGPPCRFCHWNWGKGEDDVKPVTREEYEGGDYEHDDFLTPAGSLMNEYNDLGLEESLPYDSPGGLEDY